MSPYAENRILMVDSYKSSHYLQYPPGTTRMFGYLESRGGRYGRTVFFGLQYLMQRYFSTPITVDEVEEATTFFAAHGEPFPRDGWMRIARDLNGKLPIRIRAVREGTVVPVRNVLMTVESTDPQTFWIVGWLETLLMRGLWYPTTVATVSWHCKKTILEYLVKSSDDPMGEIGFKLHDFGGRGVSSTESAAIGGAAHLVNFQGSDTVDGVVCANRHYGSKMAGFSIPATEHSTITAWGREGEADAYRNVIAKFGGKGKVVACVSDSYDLWNAVENLWSDELLPQVQASGCTVVIRPDSGNPPEVNVRLFRILDRKLGGEMRINTKGYKVLPPYFRVIQGDGNKNEDSIGDVLKAVTDEKFSASNIAFGMGGGLLQMVDRDTQRCAFKCSEVTIDGKDVAVCKNPITDPEKASKAGHLDLVFRDGTYRTVVGEQRDSVLALAYENGEMRMRTTLDEVRARALAGLS